jgi:ribonuclease D
MADAARKGRRGRRPSRRAQAHEAVHGEAERAGAQDVPSHPLIPGGEPEIIEGEAALSDLVSHVRALGAFAFDTEFIGEETYEPRICLIQVATRERVAVIDPMSGLDVSAIDTLVADEAIETIVHAGQQDLDPIARRIGRSPGRVFDTQIAAGFLDRPYPLGLRRLLEDFVGVQLRKELTFTSWDQRPLSAVHARYAADDVRYLPAACAALRERLEVAGYARWVEEECATLSDAARYRFDPDARLERLLGNRAPRPRAVAILRELVVLRNDLAREENVPPRTLLRDDVLMRLAKDPVRRVERLELVKGMPRPLARRHGAAFVGAVERAMAIAPRDLPVAPAPEESPADTARIDGLWAAVCAYCRGRSIDPGLVTGRREIARLYFDRLAGDGAAGPPLRVTSGWRAELIGAPLRALLEGRADFRFSWSNGGPAAAIEPRP